MCGLAADDRSLPRLTRSERTQISNLGPRKGGVHQSTRNWPLHPCTPSTHGRGPRPRAAAPARSLPSQRMNHPITRVALAASLPSPARRPRSPRCSRANSRLAPIDSSPIGGLSTATRGGSSPTRAPAPSRCCSAVGATPRSSRTPTSPPPGSPWPATGSSRPTRCTASSPTSSSRSASASCPSGR